MSWREKCQSLWGSDTSDPITSRAATTPLLSLLSSPTRLPELVVKNNSAAPAVESPEVGQDTAELVRASTLLNRSGARIMLLKGAAIIGVWSVLDGPEIRAALRTSGLDRLPIRYLDGAGIPTQYKLRPVEGEPVPMSVLAEMERYPAESWKIRDRLLNEMGWRSNGIDWAEWKATALNRLFQEQGTSGQPGRITAETVRHGERSRGRTSGNEAPPFVKGEALQDDATHPPNRTFGGGRR